MGYTNYWEQTRDFTNDEWIKVQQEYSWLLEMDQEKTIHNQCMGNEEIVFNGYKEDSHETMVISKKVLKDNCFYFCKTARKPYDIGVWHMLGFIKSNTGAYSEIRRDDFGDWT